MMKFSILCVILVICVAFDQAQSSPFDLGLNQYDFSKVFPKVDLTTLVDSPKLAKSKFKN